jgi:Mrp family chromosome partitioning ATPase
VKVLAEIPPRSSPDLRTGTLRRSDLEAFGGLLDELRGARAVLMTGDGSCRRPAAVGLAAAAAAAGTHTALMECELAEPGLADALGLANAPGLHEYLCGTAETESILRPVVLAGPGAAAATEPLVCVVAGRPSSYGPRLFGSDAFAQALSGIRAAYDLLVLDGPGLDQWGSLTQAMAHADVTVACLDRADSGRELSVPVAGVVIQD